jgi:hypothetical protein
VTGRVAPGWYPDYEAPPGHQRYWDGERWTERRSADAATGLPTKQVLGWLGAAVAAVVLVSAVVLVVTDDQPASSGSDSETPPASASGPPSESSQTESATPTADPAATLEVDSVLDDATIQLANGAQVVLVGVTVGDCGISALAQLVEGQEVTLTTPGTDTDPQGRLLRYVDRNGVDVGLRLVQRGLATASDEVNPRRAIYRRVDERSPNLCQ